MAVEVSGRKLLDWLEYALGVPSYFQTQQLVLGFDGSQDHPCRINMLQVGKKLRVRPALLCGAPSRTASLAVRCR